MGPVQSDLASGLAPYSQVWDFSVSLPCALELTPHLLQLDYRVQGSSPEGAGKAGGPAAGPHVAQAHPGSWQEAIRAGQGGVQAGGRQPGSPHRALVSRVHGRVLGTVEGPAKLLKLGYTAQHPGVEGDTASEDPSGCSNPAAGIDFCPFLPAAPNQAGRWAYL